MRRAGITLRIAAMMPPIARRLSFPAPATMQARLETVFRALRVTTESQLRDVLRPQSASPSADPVCVRRSREARREAGAAPLIGNPSPCDWIPRVLVMGFTVLNEGGFGPQPHCGFVGVFGEAAVDDGKGGWRERRRT
jgi:hypothetical protein